MGVRRFRLISTWTVVVGLALAACNSSTEPDAFPVHFDNDLGRSVVLALCKSDHSVKCEHPSYRVSIRDGGSHEENISPDVRTEWAVEASSGALLRCVRLYWKRYPGHTPRVSLSNAAAWSNPCPTTAWT